MPRPAIDLNRLLADPFENGAFILFPKQPAVNRERFDTLGLIWQLRHTIVHNVGVITQSDAIKLRLLVHAPVDSPRVLFPTRDDIRYLKRFLEETAEQANERIGNRLAALLSTIHAGDPGLFIASDAADTLTRKCGFALVVAGATGALPP